MIVGEVFWTIQPTTEAENYGNGYLVRPWVGKVTKLYDGHVKLCSFNEETGEPDDDDNASCHVAHNRLFQTEREALKAYRESLKERHRNLLDEIALVDKTLKSMS